MGVHSLWRLLAPVARTVRLDTLAGTRLAIDSSIWLYQFTSALRDSEGNALTNAHVLGFLRRILKLLYWGIKPVFVFDGKVPELKRGTINRRRARKDKAQDDVKVTARRLVAAQMRKAALDHIKNQGKGKAESPLKRNISAASIDPEGADYNYLIQAVAQKPSADQYNLPALPAPITTRLDPRLATEAELQSLMTELAPQDFDLTHPSFLALPIEARYELLSDLRVRSRQTTHTRLGEMVASNDPMMFSRAQIDGVKGRNKLTQKLIDILDAEAEAPRRIAGERSKEYILKKVAAEDGGGWSMSFGVDKRRSEPIQVDNSSDVEIPDGAEMDVDEDAVREVMSRKRQKKATISAQTEALASITARHYATNLEEEQRKAELIAAEEQRLLQIAQQESLWHRHTSISSSNPDEIDDDDFEPVVSTSLRVPVQPSSIQAFLNKSSSPAPYQLDKISDRSSSFSESSTLDAEIMTSRQNYLSALQDLSDTEQAEPTLQNSLPNPQISLGDPVARSKSTKQKPSVHTNNSVQPEEVSILPEVTTEQTEFKPIFTDFSNLEREISPEPIVPVLHNLSNVAPQEMLDPELPASPPRDIFELSDERALFEEDDTEKLIAPRKEISVLDFAAPQEMRPELESETVAENNSEEYHPSARLLDVNNVRNVPQMSDGNQAESEDDNTPFDWEASPERDVPTTVRIAREVEADGQENLDSDEEAADQLKIEQENYAQFSSSLRKRNIDEVELELEQEVQELARQRNKAVRQTQEIGQEMTSQIQTLLRFFGIPYVIAPSEAEAQCAELMRLNLVDGIITDDSDVFLFGGTRIFKNMFNQNQMVECFTQADLTRDLGLSREKLIDLALMLGSDYTDGLPGFGPVTAMEVLGEFGDVSEFAKWWYTVQEGSDVDPNLQTSFRKKFKRKHQALYIEENFPSQRVVEAYLKPDVDDSDESFVWGVPDLDALRMFLGETLGWSHSRVDQDIVPVIKRRVTQAPIVQSKLDNYYDLSAGTGEWRSGQIPFKTSARLQSVVKALKGDSKVEDMPATTSRNPRKATRKRKSKTTKSTKNGAGSDFSESLSVSDLEQKEPPPKPKRKRTSKKKSLKDLETSDQENKSESEQAL